MANSSRIFVCTSRLWEAMRDITAATRPRQAGSGAVPGSPSGLLVRGTAGTGQLEEPAQTNHAARRLRPHSQGCHEGKKAMNSQTAITYRNTGTLGHRIGCRAVAPPAVLLVIEAVVAARVCGRGRALTGPSGGEWAGRGRRCLCAARVVGWPGQNGAGPASSLYRRRVVVAVGGCGPPGAGGWFLPWQGPGVIGFADGGGRR
jgi:hypothetical protein